MTAETLRTRAVAVGPERLRHLMMTLVVVSVIWMVASGAAHLVPSVAGAEVTSWLIALVATIGLVMRFGDRQELDASLTWPETGTLLLVAGAFVAVFLNGDASPGGGLRVLQHASIVLAIASLEPKWRSVRFVTLGLAAGVAVQVAVALVELGAGRTFFYSLWKPLEAATWHGFMRLGSTPADPNYLALSVVTTLPVIWLIHRMLPANRIVSLIGTLAWLLVALFTFSRAGYVGILLTPLAYLAVTRRFSCMVRVGPGLRARYVLASLMLVAIGFLLRDQMGAIVARLASMGGGTTDASINTRVAAQIAAAQVFVGHPLGIGFDRFVTVGPTYVAAISNVRVPEINVLDSYLLTAAEGGVLSLIGFAIATLSSLAALSQRTLIRRVALAQDHAVLAALAAGFVVWSLMSFTLDAFHSPANWVFIGIAALVVRTRERAMGSEELASRGFAGAAVAVGAPAVDVVVVSYNTRAATLRCLEALHNSKGARLSIVLVDNASSDGTAQASRERYPDIAVIENQQNRGYGAACNQGTVGTSSRYVLVLNSDCFVESDTIARCVAFLEQHPASSGVACQLVYQDGNRQASCRRFPTVTSELAKALIPYRILRRIPGAGGYFLAGWDHAGIRMVDQPAGAFLLTRRGAWGGGPLFDERFFMYYEDVDLCRRLWEYGPIWFLSSTSAVHLGEHSSSKVMADMSAALATSRYRYFNKWSGQPVARLVSLIGAIGSLLRAMAWAGATSLRIERSRARMAAHIAAARVGVRAFVHPHEFAYP